MRGVRTALALAAALAVVAPGSMARAGSAPLIVRTDKNFGRILLTRAHKALYFWGVEKRAGRIVCTGSCLDRWPPLVVKSRAAAPKSIPGVKGSFGVVRRPDGRLQVTYKGLALHADVEDAPNEVRCNNVERWFVVCVERFRACPNGSPGAPAQEHVSYVLNLQGLYI